MKCGQCTRPRNDVWTVHCIHVRETVCTRREGEGRSPPQPTARPPADGQLGVGRGQHAAAPGGAADCRLDLRAQSKCAHAQAGESRCSAQPKAGRARSHCCRKGCNMRVRPARLSWLQRVQGTPINTQLLCNQRVQGRPINKQLLCNQPHTRAVTAGLTRSATTTRSAPLRAHKHSCCRSLSSLQPAAHQGCHSRLDQVGHHHPERPSACAQALLLPQLELTATSRSPGLSQPT